MYTHAFVSVHQPICLYIYIRVCTCISLSLSLNQKINITFQLHGNLQKFTFKTIKLPSLIYRNLFRLCLCVCLVMSTYLINSHTHSHSSFFFTMSTA